MEVSAQATQAQDDVSRSLVRPQLLVDFPRLS